jgi:hypothetical protein
LRRVDKFKRADVVASGLRAWRAALVGRQAGIARRVERRAVREEGDGLRRPAIVGQGRRVARPLQSGLAPGADDVVAAGEAAAAEVRAVGRNDAFGHAHAGEDPDAARVAGDRRSQHADRAGGGDAVEVAREGGVLHLVTPPVVRMPAPKPDSPPLPANVLRCTETVPPCTARP